METEENGDDNKMHKDNIKNILKLLEDKKLKHREELVSFIFGRSTEKTGKKSKSIFEMILETEDSEKLIQLIWDKFDLHSSENILSAVSILKSFLSQFL